MTSLRYASPSGTGKLHRMRLAGILRPRPPIRCSACWSPTLCGHLPDELDDLGEELSFRGVIGMFSTGEPRDEVALRAQVADIAERKRRLCPDDPRQIVRVDVVPRGRNVEVLP
jgi:hypothetical protein